MCTALPEIFFRKSQCIFPRLKFQNESYTIWCAPMFLNLTLQPCISSNHEYHTKTLVFKKNNKKLVFCNAFSLDFGTLPTTCGKNLHFIDIYSYRQINRYINRYSYNSCIIKLQATLKVSNAKGFSKAEVKHQVLFTVAMPITKQVLGTQQGLTGYNWSKAKETATQKVSNTYQGSVMSDAELGASHGSVYLILAARHPHLQEGKQTQKG